MSKYKTNYINLKKRTRVSLFIPLDILNDKNVLNKR